MPGSLRKSNGGAIRPSAAMHLLPIARPCYMPARRIGDKDFLIETVCGRLSRGFLFASTYTSYTSIRPCIQSYDKSFAAPLRQNRQPASAILVRQTAPPGPSGWHAPNSWRGRRLQRSTRWSDPSVYCTGGLWIPNKPRAQTMATTVKKMPANPVPK
jgi:hypothetical protein